MNYFSSVSVTNLQTLVHIVQIFNTAVHINLRRFPYKTICQYSYELFLKIRTLLNILQGYGMDLAKNSSTLSSDFNFYYFRSI